MARQATPFDRYRYEYSLRASEVAQKGIYLEIFGPDTKVRVKAGSTADMRQATDTVVRSSFGEFKVQERFRTFEYADRRQLTFTLWSHFNNSKSEWEKLSNVDYFLYGYFDGSEFGEVVCVDMKHFRMLFMTNQIKYESFFYKRKRQECAAVDFDVLKAAGCIVWHSADNEPSELVKLYGVC